MAKFPAEAYLNDIPEAGKMPGIEYPPLHHMDIGARKSGVQEVNSRRVNAIQHVGSSATGRKG